jgi:hypothetical protein
MRSGQLIPYDGQPLWYELRLGTTLLLEGRFRTREEAQAYKNLLEQELSVHKLDIVEVKRIDEETDFT